MHHKVFINLAEALRLALLIPVSPAITHVPRSASLYASLRAHKKKCPKNATPSTTTGNYGIIQYAFPVPPF
uniref:Putative secreted protein n=1 Tax=Anopheles triannulatus TaxID=58253 RepID=A0A2M4B6T0_9DIPT